jgi:choline kinase
VPIPQSKLSVILLAAGIGRRLGAGRQAPKVLLDFDGATLIARHIRMLSELGVARITVVTGFMADTLKTSIAALAPRVPVTLVHNPRFDEGSVVSFAVGAAHLAAERGEATGMVLMDGDVLYDSRMLKRLFAATGENILLVDRDIEPGDEPVKICFDGADRIVDFRKKPEHAHVRHGESVGFFRFSAVMAATLGARAQAYAADDRARLEYEEVIRDLILLEPDRFHAEDISDLPWTEIDFPEDVARARDEILPQLESAS